MTERDEMITDITSTSVIDPFSGRKELELFKQWLLLNQEEFNKYEEELRGYSTTAIPLFMYKSTDKYILKILEIYKQNNVPKPATTFFEVLKDVYTSIGHPFIEILLQRMAQDIDALNRFKNPSSPEEKKEMTTILKERGFM